MNTDLRIRNTQYAILAACLFAVAVQAVPSAEQLRTATLEHIHNGTEEAGIAEFTDYLGGQLSATTRVPTRDLTKLAVVAECIRFMKLLDEVQSTDAVAEWILDSGERLQLFIDMLEPKDRGGRCMEIMNCLHTYDPAGCDEFYELILAIALVMDRPAERPMHGQMGQELLPHAPDPVERYDYFKALYVGGDAKIEYGKLGASELLFVVHVPVPASELEWVRNNVGGSLADWGEKYSGIPYDHARLESSRYQWDSGPYSLAGIRGEGGICVDQAYYAVMTARAYGIPAIYFHGSGNSGNHAWFAFMKAPGEWELDVGRYKNSEYTTGYAINPQTGESMTDHDVNYACERSLHSDDLVRASEYVSIAEVLLASDPRIAARCAKNARQRVKRYLRPWEIERQVLIDEKNCNDLLQFFAEQKDAFRKYPDILTESAKEIEVVLREEGRTKEADKLMRDLAGTVDDDRDDLANMFEFGRIEKIIESGDMKKARKKMEQLLDDQKDGGNKVFWLIRKYAEFVVETGQSHEASKFLPDYVEELRSRYNFPTTYEQGLLMCLHKVYEGDGDTKNAQLIMYRIESLERLKKQ